MSDTSLLPHDRLPLFKVPGGACTVYQGDASFDHGELDRPGPRHRLYMLQSRWRYENTL
jgi:hypothetical protein